MPINSKVKKLYDALKADGGDVGTPEEFNSWFFKAGKEGYRNRKSVYDTFKADGADVGKSYEEFGKWLGLHATYPTVNKYRQQMFNSVDPNKSRASELTHRAVGQAVRATNNVRKPVTAKVVNQHGKPTGEEFAITPAKTVEDLDREYAQETTKNWENELHNQMADADRDAAKISDMFKSFIGSTDEVGSVWGNMTRGGGIAGTPHSVTTNNGIMENTEARQLLAAGDYNRKRRELLQLEQDSRLSKDTSLLGGVREAYNDIKNGEFSKAGKDLVYGAGFDDHSFWRGMYDAAKDTGFLTGGASDLINAGSLLATKQDLDNGVHTEAGDMLMQQAVKNSDAQSQYGDNHGWMYTGGVITTNMAPFMVQIGSAGFSKGMSNAIGKVVQGAASKVALGTMNKAIGLTSTHVANIIGKMTGLTTKAFGKAIQYGIVGAAQANTVGLGNVANDVINRYTGQVYQDEQGNYKFGTFDSDGKLVHEGGEDFLTALVKGEAAQTIEFATELAGGGIDAVGTALKNFVTKGGKKIINKYNMENVSKVINFLLNNKVSKNARYLKAGADRTLGKVELNSIVGESLEEELGIIANTVFTGDNKISDLWDEKQQSQIWGGMLLSIGLMKGAVAPFHAYNAKQYYSYKHKLDKADVNLSQLLGKEKWEELRNQIDATTNEDMPEMVNKINRDVALGKNRQPVREYIQNLLIMRGYDIGNMLAAKKAVEDKGEGVSVKNMEKNQAYQQGRDAYGYDTHEIQLDQEDKQKSLAQLLGISEQQLASMSDEELDALSGRDEELDALSGRDDNIDRAIYDYQLSSARYEGVIDNARDQIDLEVQRAAQAVDMYTDKSRNTIRNATIKATGGLEDYGVYIINGNIATHEDGSIDISNSDDMILYYDPTTNTVEHADAMMFAELGSEENADEVRNQAMADAKEKAIKETTGIIDGVVEVGTQFKTVDADGTEHTYEVLADNGDGTAMITIDGNIPTELVKGENVNVPVSFEELQKMKDASDQQRLQAAKAQREQMEKERAEQQNQAQTTQAENPAQESNTQPSPIEDNLDYSDIIREDGKVQMVDVSDKDGNNLFPDAKDVFYIQGNKMRTKFAYIDANGELKTQSFPTGLVKIKTRGEVSVDDYKKYRNTILAAESSAMPESSMIEDNSGTIEADRGGIEVGDNTQPLSEADADNVIAQMESSAEVVPELELTPDNWAAEFGEDGIVSTPVGDVKMGENQVAKLFEKGRSKEFGMIKPTLTNPDVIIEVPSHSADGNEERSSSYLFIKTFLGKNGKKVYYFKSVTIKKDGLEISISSHYDRAKRVKEALMKGKLLYRKNDGAQTEQNQPSTSVTTSQEDAAGSSESKDTNISANGNENNESLTFEDGTPIPVDVNGEVDLSQTDAAHAAEWYDTNLGEDADDYLDGEIKKAKKVLEQAHNKKITGTKPSELVASKKEKEAAIADAQAHYDSAISIRDALNERQLAKVEDTAEGRKNLIEKARRKFARLKSAVKDDAEAVAQLYKETVGTLLHRLYDSTGIDVTDTIPLTAEEYVASNLGAHSLNYEGTETSKGVKQETGLSREDFAKTQLLAADGKGTTIDALVHSLWENRPSNLDSLDTQDIRNAMLSVITSGFKASEAKNYIENLRIAQAENFLEEQKKAADNAAFAEENKAEAEQQTETAPESEEKTGEENSDEINDEENEKINEQTNENINTPEVPEDATAENPLGLQLSDDKVPFEIEGGKSGETYDITDNEDRQRLINDNKVDDKDILDIDMPKHVHKAIKELCKKMGLKVQFLYMGARSNGWIENGTMYLALDTEKATQFVFGHEMTHAIKQKNPEAYKELVKVAMAVTTKKKFEEDLAKVYQNYHGISGYNNVDDYVEEVVADNLGKFINNFDLAQKFSLRLNHPVLATILHAIQKIKSLLYGDFYKSVDALERIVEKAYVDTANGEITNSETGEDVSFSLRQKPEPKKKGIGYKVFVLKDGKLYPPMVANPDGAATPVGVWLDADAAPIAGESKTGRPQVKQGGKGTQGGSGKLAYRPGWHLGVVPYAIQFNRKDAEGNKTLFPKNFVFAEVEYAADVDYQEEARQEGINPSGKYQHSLAGLKHLPTDGYYMYRTNPNPETDPWVITGAMKVNRILTRAEQAELVKNAGREPQQIQEGDIVTDDVVNSINQEIADAPKFSLKVYHGSGADFTEFDFDHIGEGAGSQTFGWGGYVTSSKKIGKSYATLMDNDPSKAYYRIQRSNGTRFAKKYPTLESFLHGDKQIAMNDKFTEQEKIDYYNEMKKLAEPYHNLYEVDIPDDDGSNYLDFENPMSEEQINAIRDALAKKGVDVPSWEKRGFKLDLPFKDVYAAVLPMMMRCEPKEVSKFLSSLGFTGIKYPAGTIMGGAEEGDTNYVIFKPEDMKITEHTKFSLKSKPVRFEAGKQLSDEEKKEVLSTLKDAYKVNGVPYHIEETAGGKEKRVYEPTADSYVVSDITNRPLRYYITLPDGRVAHPTEVYPNISDNEVKSSAIKQGLLDDEVDQIVRTAIGNMKNVADNAKAVEVLTELQNLPHETHDVGYGMNNAQSYNYKTGIFTSDAAQAIDYVVRRMRRKEDVPAEIPAALKKAVADSYGMVDNLIDGMSSTKFSLKKDGLTPEIANTPVNIVDADEEHGFKNYAEAREWAKKNIVRTYNDEETGGKGEINISNTAVGKYLSEKAIDKSISKDVHMSVLKVLPSVLRESVDAYQHGDRKKVNNVRSEKFGINPDVMIHRCFGAVNIAGKVYGVKITLKENVKTRENKKLYSYEATKIELLDGKNEGVTMTPSLNSNNSITVAKIAKVFETTKKNGEKVDNEGTKFSLKDEEYLKAVEDGNMEKAQKMVNEAAKAAGYSSDSSYQGTSAFNGAAPWGNGYFLTKDERKEAWDNGEFEGESTLGDYINDDIDGGNLEELTNAASYRAADPMRKEAIDNVRNAIQKKAKTITMYRSVPSDVKEGSFRNGDWVTPSRAYAVDNAKLHGWGDDYNIIEQKVPVDDVWFDGNDIAEWGYGREEDYINDTDFAYKNSKNNKKLLDAVTYDDNGNVIPLSQRFNEKNKDVRFSLKDEKTMFGMHNISLDKLRKAIKQGGFAAPSMGVIDSKNGIYSDYGAITLIPKAEKLAKMTGKNAGTFLGDGWTPIYPTVERVMNKQGEKAFKKDMDNLYDDADANVWSNIKESWKGYFDNNDVRDGLYWHYLYDKGKNPEIVYQKGRYDTDIAKEVMRISDNGWKNDYTDAEVAELIQLKNKATGEDNDVDSMRNTLEKQLKNAEKRGNGLLVALKKKRLSELEGIENFYIAADFAKDVARDARNNGKPSVSDTMNAAKQKVQGDKKLSTDFTAWLENKSEEYGAEEMFYTGTTPTGKPKYIPNTVENAVKLMKKKSLAGGYGMFGSVGSFIAKHSDMATTLKQMKAAKGKLISKADAEKRDKMRDEIYREFSSLANQIDVPGGYSFDSGANRMLELADHKGNEKKYIKETYKMDVSDEWVNRYNKLVDTIKNDYPVYYFETKFMRPYGLDEFEKAIVPNDTPSDVVDALKKAGIDVSSYERGNAEDRQKVTMDAINSSDNIRFSLAGERGASAADKAEERTARMDNLSVARKMEEEKKDAKAIKMATGWERGADGKWRYEMPDAKIKDTIDVGGGHIVKRYEDDMLWNGGKLSEKIDAPELFKAYPQLKDVRIETDAIMNDMPSNGEYNSKTNTITIHADELKYMNDILNHEIQHAIQDIEGFAKGGSPRLIRGEVKKKLNEVTKQIRQLRAEGKEDEAKALVEKNRGLYNAYQKNDDYNSYKSLAGEVEARNVSARLNMTPEERRKSLAESTEDVARKDQIFLGVGDVSFSLRDIADGKENGAADMVEDLKSLNTPDEVDDAIKTAIEDMPSGWQMANKKMIHVAQALGENRKAEIAGEEPKFSLKDGSLIKAGTYFSGGGLVEEGLKGIIDPVVAVEYDEKISGVYRNNFGQHIVTADVRDVDPKELVKQIDGEVEYFHASPVCKNYSQAKSNHAEVELDKETAASTAEFINAVKPKVVTIENVKGYKDSDAMKTITDALDANGYTWDADVYNAADYGGYTNRERLIVRAVRDGKLPDKPKKMAHKSGWYEAVADIIPTLTEKKNGVAPWMDVRLKADGIDWRNIDKPLYVMGSAYADGKVPHAFADELLPTLRTKSGDVIVMPDGKVYRAMGRVLARVSGVSDDYKMPFSENLSHTIIGNGIPTQLTEHVIAPLVQNTLRPTTPEDGNTKFSLRGSTPYDKQMEEWMEKNHLEKGAVPMEKPIMKEGENIFDYANRMVEWTRNQNLWKTAPKQTGFQDALEKWKADNGLSPDAYPPVRPHRENYSTEIGYAEDLEEYNKKKELWKSAPKPKDFDLSIDLDDMNKQLRNIRRAVLNQKNYDQRTVKAVSDLVRKMLNIGWGDGLSRGKVGNLLSAAKNATGANDVKKYLDKAMGILAENYLNRLSTAYDNLINTKGARADQSGVIKMGSLDAKGQAFMSEYKKAINMDDKSLNTYIANIEEDSAKNEDNVEMNDYRLAGIQAAIMFKQQIGGNDADIAELQRQIGELKNKKDATKEDKDLLKSLEKKLFENKFDRITMYENLLNNIQRMVKESKGRAKEFREELAEHKNEILHRANLDLEGVDSTYYDTTTAKKKFVNNPILRFVMSSTYTFEQFLKFFGRHHANGEGYLYNYFMSEWHDAADEQQLYNEMNRNALDEKTKELFGKKNFTKLVGIDGKGMKEMDIDVTDYSNKKTGKRTIHLKQGQMLYIYLVNKETDGEMKLRAMGITEEDVAAIEENLDPRVKAMGEWLQDEYLPECQRRYQATHTKYFGAPMKEVENYFPLAINNRARNVREDLNQDTDAISRLAGTSTGAIITRRVNVIPLDIENADAFAAAFNHLDEMEKWSAYLPFIQDVNTLLSSTHFKNQVMNMSSAAYGSGETLWEEFKKVAQIAAGTYKPKVDKGMMDSKIAAVVGGIATAKISGRLWTAFKQTQSATTFLTECDPARFLWYGVNPYGSWHWAYDNLPLFRKRVEQLTAGDVKVRQFLDELEKYHDWTKTIAKVGMSPNILVDSVTCAVGARSVYETELNKLTKLGYPKDKAEEKAIQKASLSYNKTQQSYEGAFLSPMQIDRTYVSAALSLYKNANYAYGRKKIEAIRGIAKTYRFWGEHKNAMIGSMTRQIMDEDGLDENVANAIAKRAYTRTFWYNIGTLLNYMTIVPVSWAAYKVLLYLLTGDDDDKKWKMIEEACLKGLATTSTDDYVIPFASNILDAGLNIEDGKIGFDTDVFKYQNLYINPATSDLSNIYSMIGNQKWWSAGNKLGMLGIQMLVGFNPETVGALYQAYDEFDKNSGNMPLEVKLAVLKSISAPEESIRGLYMDELGLGDEERTKVPLSVLEQRYAERQINRDNLLSQIAMPKETFDGYVEKYKKSFEKKIQEKMDKMDAYDQKKFDAIFDTTTDPTLKGMMEKKRTKDANAAADEQIAKEGLNQEKKGKEPSEEAYDEVKMSIDVAEDNAISTYNKVLNKRYAALNDEYNEQTDAMKYIFMSKHPNFKAYKDIESEYTNYGKKIKELKEKLVSADGYDAKQTILKQIRAEREKFDKLQSNVK